MNKPEGQREMGSEGIEVSAVSSRTGGVVRGSTLLVGGLLAVVAVVIFWLGLTGRLSDLRHANLPLHPYPPAGYAYNPFDPGNKDDLINVAEANTVKADLLADGKVENDALARGDASSISQVSTGGALASLRRLIDTNNQQGISEKTEVNLQSVSVGKLADPNNASIAWCVQEAGGGTLTFVKQADGNVLRIEHVRFQSKYWLTKNGEGKYVIADSLVTLQ